MENNLTNGQSQSPLGVPLPPKKKDNSSFLIQGGVALGMIILSFIIAFMVYIPYIQQISDLKEQQTETRAEVQRLETKYSEITGMGKQGIDANLEKARRIVPDDIRLSELATFINANAQKFDLEVAKLNLVENTTDVRKDLPSENKVVATNAGQQITLGTIDGPFSLFGEKKDIFRFLDFLVDGGFATNFDRVQITPGENGEWLVNFVAVHHYLGPAKGVPAEAVLLKPRLDLLNVNTPVTPTPTGTSTQTNTPTTSVTASPTPSQ